MSAPLLAPNLPLVYRISSSAINPNTFASKILTEADSFIFVPTSFHHKSTGNYQYIRFINCH